MIVYLTKKGEMLDEICFRFYGATANAFDKVLELNRHLSAYGPVLPADVAISLPDLSTQAAKKEVSLWD